MSWIFFTILAVGMQTVRTAGQKQLGSNLPPLVVTWVRFGFGLPFVLTYWLLLRYNINDTHLQLSFRFFGFSLLAAVAQIIATVLLVTTLKIRNFSVGTTFAKTEAIFTALLGFLFFYQPLAFLAWLAISLGVLGTVLAGLKMSASDYRKIFQEPTLLYGLGAGLGFGLASLWLREASLSLNSDFIYSAATTLLTVVTLQVLLSSAPLWRNPTAIIRQFRHWWKLCCFIGFTSAAGSVGWFTAMTLHSAAIVKGLGQMEFILSVLITTLYFREKISINEWIGMILVTLSVLLLLINH